MKTTNSLLKQNNLFLKAYILIMSLEYIIEYYSGIEGERWAIFLYRGLAIFVVVFSFQAFRRTEKALSSYCLMLSFFFIFNLVVSVLFTVIPGYNSEFSYSAFLYFQILLAICFRKTDISDYERVFKIIAALGVIVVYTTFVYNKIDISSALRRGYAWTNLFFLNSIYWAVVPIVLYSFIFHKFRPLAVIYGISAIAFNMLFLKRYIIVDAALLVFFVSIIGVIRKEIRTKTFLLISVLAIVGIILINRYQESLIMTLFSGSINRFSNTNIAEFERFEESRRFFSNSAFWEVLIGRGFCGIHYELGVKAYALHMGWGNYFLKGGLFFFCLMFTPSIRAIRLFSKFKSLDLSKQWFTSFVVIESIRFFYVNNHSFCPELFFYVYACIMIMTVPLHTR